MFGRLNKKRSKNNKSPKLCLGDLIISSTHLLPTPFFLSLCVLTIYLIFYAITLCFIMFICPFVGPLIWTTKILYRISLHSMWQITTKHFKVKVHWHFVIDKHCDRAITTLNYTPIITHVTLVYIGVIFLSHELIITCIFIHVRVCLFLYSAHIELGH